jgi:5,10-methylenetetrahydrofolate reductase
MLASDISFSLEFSPPRKPGNKPVVLEVLPAFLPFNPTLATLTYHFKDSPRDAFDVLQAVACTIQQEHKLPVAAHLTTSPQIHLINEFADDLQRNNITRIIAIGGDKPKDQAQADKYFRSTAEMVERLLKRHPSFDVTVGVSPELAGHTVEKARLIAIDSFIKKLGAGAKDGITQPFLDPNIFFDLQNGLEARGIHKDKLIAGIYPITRGEPDFELINGLMGAHVPDAVRQRFASLQGDALMKEGAYFIAEQIAGLSAKGVKRFHLFTRNDPEIWMMAFKLLGLPLAAPAAEASNAPMSGSSGTAALPGGRLKAVRGPVFQPA